MPLSKSRKSKKPAYTPPAEPGAKAVRIGNPAWLVPTMLTLMIVGLLWIVVFYLAGNQVPVMKNLNNLENILVGFGFIGVGFGLATRWK
jgi:paraquat-inducible protein B